MAVGRRKGKWRGGVELLFCKFINETVIPVIVVTIEGYIFEPPGESVRENIRKTIMSGDRTAIG